MGKVKIKKNDVWIDMTPMSDVMVLLLTFFMLTSNFTKSEPVKVTTPGSVSEIKVPEKDVLNILVGNDGKIFMSMDKTTDVMSVLETITGDQGISLNPEQTKKFKEDAMWGASFEQLPNYLSLSKSDMATAIKGLGIPTDSIKGGQSEFQMWVQAAIDAVNMRDGELKLCIKADEKTPYKTVKKLMSELQDMGQNRYYLITSYKKVED